MSAAQRSPGPSPGQVRRVTSAVMVSLVTLGCVSLVLDLQLPLWLLIAAAVIAAIGIVVLVVTTARLLRR